MDSISSIFSYSFMVNALIGGTLISVCAALLGVILVLKRYSMIGDGLSHVGFGAMAIASVAGITPTYLAIPIVAVSAILLMRGSGNNKMKGDAAIGLLSTGALAIGIIAVSVGGVNTDLNAYLFGSILSLTKEDMILCLILTIITISLFVFIYNPIFTVTFDESFAKATGIKTEIYKIVISCLTAVTVVLGMRMMGTLLISALIIMPAVTSMRIFKTFRATCISSVIVALICFSAGLVLSFVLSVPAGATVVAVNILAYFVVSATSYILRR